MKAVIVFDTDDPQGMENSWTIMKHLAREYLGSPGGKKIVLNKVQFIRHIRDHGRLIEKEESTTGLRDIKAFVDKVWATTETYVEDIPNE